MPRSSPSLDLERRLIDLGHRVIAGVDEVGRGSLAGPIVAAAVVLPLDDPLLPSRLDGVNDSKQLSPSAREKLAGVIIEAASAVGFGWSSHAVIDREGVGAANRLAMARALRNLGVTPEAVLLDYERLPMIQLPQLSVPQGDALSLSIASASILAKVMRDRYMTHTSSRYPGYGFSSHKGYCTQAHRDALAALGPCHIHRRSFRPVAEPLL